MTEQIISKVVMPSDRNKAWNLEYSVEVPDYGEEEGSLLSSFSIISETFSSESQ